MSTAPETTVPFSQAESAQAPDEAQKKQPKPTKILPTNRVATAKQFEILRAFGAISGPDAKPVANTEVAKIVNLHASTVGLTTPFFVDAGLLRKVAEGLVPSSEVADFTRAHEWNPDSAFHRLAPALRKMWFFNALSPKLRFSAMTRSGAIQELAISASAATCYRSQLEALLEYLSEAGLIQLDGDQVRLARQSAAPEEGHEVPQPEPPTDQRRSQAALPRQTAVNTTFGSQAAGVIQFNISVKVDTADFATWEPTRIAAFFAGIAQVLAAKGAVEERSTKS